MEMGKAEEVAPERGGERWRGKEERTECEESRFVVFCVFAGWLCDKKRAPVVFIERKLESRSRARTCTLSPE